MVMVVRGRFPPSKAGGEAATSGGIGDVPTCCGGAGFAEARTSGRRLSSSLNNCLS